MPAAPASRLKVPPVWLKWRVAHFERLVQDYRTFATNPEPGYCPQSPPGIWLVSVTERRPALPPLRERSVTKRDQENPQWEMSALSCPACPRTMRLVGRERAEKETSGYLLTFQRDC